MVTLRTYLGELLRSPARIRTRRRMLREIEEHPERAITTWKRETCDQLFYLFHGLELQLMMDPLTVLRETGLIRRNLLLLKDYYRFYYHAGLSREIPDTAALVARLRQARAEMPHVARTYTLGTSSGGYAAILFGHLLEVDEVYAFAPQTVLDMALVRLLSGRRDLDRIPDEHRDLRRLLERQDGSTRTKIFYCQGRAVDARLAEHVADCPGVELHPQPGDTHLVLQVMHAAGTLRSALPPEPATAAPSAPQFEARAE